MKKKTLFIGCILFCFISAFAQKQKGKISELDYIHFIPDKLYWQKQTYMINRSFLSFFKDYQKLYPNVPITEISPLYGGGGAPIGQNYSPAWLLQDSILYLRDIYFYESKSALERYLPHPEPYTRMEKLTGQKFQKGLIKEGIRPPESDLGSMKATWVDGSFYVKRQARESENVDEWDKLPFQKLTFKAGKLVSVETVPAPKRNQ